jgi:hypothetical protein
VRIYLTLVALTAVATALGLAVVALLALVPRSVGAPASRGPRSGRGQ